MTIKTSDVLGAIDNNKKKCYYLKVGDKKGLKQTIEELIKEHIGNLYKYDTWDNKSLLNYIKKLAIENDLSENRISGLAYESIINIIKEINFGYNQYIPDIERINKIYLDFDVELKEDNNLINLYHKFDSYANRHINNDSFRGDYSFECMKANKYLADQFLFSKKEEVKSPFVFHFICNQIKRCSDDYQNEDKVKIIAGYNPELIKHEANKVLDLFINYTMTADIADGYLNEFRSKNFKAAYEVGKAYHLIENNNFKILNEIYSKITES